MYNASRNREFVILHFYTNSAILFLFFRGGEGSAVRAKNGKKRYNKNGTKSENFLPNGSSSSSGNVQHCFP